MPINDLLQSTELDSIPFMGSGKTLIKKYIDIGSKVIIRDLSGLDYQVKISELSSDIYTGTIVSNDVNAQRNFEKNSVILFNKENIFLIL